MIELIPGHRYKVSFSDCCVDGSFTDTFVEFKLDEDGDPDRAVFMGGDVGPSWGQITYEEA